MSLSKKIKQYFWEIRFLNKKFKLNFSYFKFFLIKKILPCRPASNLDLNKIKKILIVRNDKHGDLIATTGLIRTLAKNGYDVHVSSEKSSLDIIKYNPYVKGSFEYKDNSLKDLFRSIKNIRQEEFDLAIDLKFCQGIYKKNIFFCSFIRTPILMGFNKSNIPSYNISIPYYQETAHVTSRLPLILKTLEIPDFDLHYEIFTTPEMKQKTDLFLKEIKNDNKKIAVFNPLGGNKSRWLTSEQIMLSIKLLANNYQIILIGDPNQLVKLNLPNDIPIFKSQNILEVVPLIEKADLVFTVDTSIVHVASAYSQTTIALYLYPAKNESADQYKAEYRKKVTQYGTHLLNRLTDAPYIQNNNYDKNPPINHLNWAPNNPNAQQLIFNYNAFSEIPLEKFSEKIILAINKSS